MRPIVWERMSLCRFQIVCVCMKVYIYAAMHAWLYLYMSEYIRSPLLGPHGPSSCVVGGAFPHCWSLHQPLVLHTENTHTHKQNNSFIIIIIFFLPNSDQNHSSMMANHYQNGHLLSSFIVLTSTILFEHPGLTPQTFMCSKSTWNRSPNYRPPTHFEQEKSRRVRPWNHPFSWI